VASLKAEQLLNKFGTGCTLINTLWVFEEDKIFRFYTKLKVLKPFRCKTWQTEFLHD